VPSCFSHVLFPPSTHSHDSFCRYPSHFFSVSCSLFYIVSRLVWCGWTGTAEIKERTFSIDTDMSTPEVIQCTGSKPKREEGANKLPTEDLPCGYPQRDWFKRP
jgi:hypothetical protein